MTTVACVLKTSTEYDARYAHALARGVAQHLPGARFACLSDDPSVPGYVPLAHPWPRHWCLVNWFAPGLFTGRVIAFGLDTLLVGSLADLAAYDGPLAGIDDFYKPKDLASGVMAWTGDEAAPIYDAFRRDPAGIMQRYKRMDPWLRTVVPKAERLQRHVPGQIVSYKRDGRREVPDGARVVAFHGRPRPADAKGWAAAMWEGLVRAA